MAEKNLITFSEIISSSFSILKRYLKGNWLMH